ncbi:ecfT Energy-coupling factor transporter transmembrane protein EcfT [Methylophilaceae bacterium]
MLDLKTSFFINTITQISCFLVIAILMNQFNLTHLLILCTLLIVALIAINSQHFFCLLKRMKWFFLVMLLIFIFNTPGQHVEGWDYFLSPTYEGLASGLLQVFRMLALIAVLSLIMALNTRQQLISGFYFMLLPLQRFGLEIERFAARLCLTLYYVESSQQNQNQIAKQKGLLNQLKVFGNNSIMQKDNFSILFEMPVFKKIDILVLSCLMMICVYALLKVYT